MQALPEIERCGFHNDSWEIMSHYLSEIAFDANGHMPDMVNGRRRPKPRLAVDLEKARRFAEESFHAGTLAALDVVFLHDQPTIAGEIVNATDQAALLRHAVREKYMYLRALRGVIAELRRRRKLGARKGFITRGISPKR